ncbi:MAG: hypothetical protein VCD00_11445 [Candidatus Hydrogenedentota bacterium]
MTLPTTGANARKIENLQIGGGYNEAADGGVDIDQTGHIAANSDLTIDGSITFNGFLNMGMEADLEIATGVITVTQTRHTVDVEGGVDSSDDLDTINGGTDGDLVLLRAKNGGRTIIITENGNIAVNGTTRTLDYRDDRILLTYSSFALKWIEVAFANNS